MKFSRTYKNWVLHDQEHLNITEVESEGETLEELLENAMIYICTWHGGEGPDYDAGDLHSKDYRMLEEEFTAFLADRADKEYDDYVDNLLEVSFKK